MDAIFVNSENSKTSDPHRPSILKRKDKYVALSNLSIYYMWRNVKKPYKNNESKTSPPT